MTRASGAVKASRRRKPRPRSFGQRMLLRFGWLLPVGAVVVGLGVLALTYAFASIPLPRDIKLPSAAEVYDRQGDLIGVFSSEERRFLIDTDKLLQNHPYVGQAVVATEDKDFYEHNGLSLKGMARAAWADLTSGEIEQGGSTISQQYIKNAVLQDTGRTVTRKLKEAVLAIKLERRYSKNQILGFYLNTVYFGRGAYGIEAAARAYFGKHAYQLTLGEAAYLAGIIPAPESYQPDLDPQGARQRRDRVLALMVEQGYIGADDERKFSHGKVKVPATAVDAASGRQRAAYFMEWLRRELEKEYGPELYTKGYEIHTTLDLRYQDAAEDAISSVLTERNDPQAALVSATPTGAVRAFVGGRAFESVKKARGFNFASDNYRQAGSAFKPFTLLTAIDQGISPKSRFSGESPATITNPACSDPEDGLWEPENFGGESYGTITLIEATTNSVNTVFARLIAEIGPQPVADMVGKFEFDGDPRTPRLDPMPPNCSLALGTPDVSPVEMARAYAGFAGRGRLPEIQPLVYIERADGTCVKVYRPTEGGDCGKGDEDLALPQQVVEQNSVDVLSQVLTNVVEGGTGTAADIGRPVAGKTGTTQENVDAWFAGYTPQLATVVWMGYPAEHNGNLVPQMRACDDPKLCRPVHGYDVTGGGTPVSPAPVWAAFMRVAMTLDDFPVELFQIPLDEPDEVINPSPPPSPAPVATKSAKPTPSPEPTKSPTPKPSPEPTKSPKPSPEPSNSPKPEPTKTPGPEPTKSPKPDKKGKHGGNGKGQP
jgi:penicillin-binding protein 1A